MSYGKSASQKKPLLGSYRHGSYRHGHCVFSLPSPVVSGPFLVPKSPYQLFRVYKNICLLSTMLFSSVVLYESSPQTGRVSLDYMCKLIVYKILLNAVSAKQKNRVVFSLVSICVNVVVIHINSL